MGEGHLNWLWGAKLVPCSSSVTHLIIHLLLYFNVFPYPWNRLNLSNKKRRRRRRNLSHRFPLKLFLFLSSSIFKKLFSLNISIDAFPINSPSTANTIHSTEAAFAKVAMKFRLPNSASPQLLDLMSRGSASCSWNFSLVSSGTTPCGLFYLCDLLLIFIVSSPFILPKNVAVHLSSVFDLLFYPLHFLGQ